ncbi:MAG: apolipoprotein N-acyltransferase [Marinilabiliales bacterium]|nr:MAG: apolipoprotein N-acyltransferase [Marinilabiliales bacterium]
MTKLQRYFLSLLTGILLSLSWYQQFSGIFCLAAFIPLLFVEDFFYQHKKTFKPSDVFAYATLSFTIWNLLSTFWIKNSDIFAAVTVILLNSVFMALTFLLFHITKRRFGYKVGNFSLIVYWISFEYYFLHAHLTWPWLNLGNSFAGDIKLIQWYEYTGVLGGTLWILILNLLLFNILKFFIRKRKIKAQILNINLFVLLLITPILSSIIIYKNHEETGKEIKIALIQPNFDPYKEKYEIDQDYQLATILNLSDRIIDQNINYIIAPETAISDPIWEHNLESDSLILRIKSFVNKHPKITYIIGASTFKKLETNEHLPISARFNANDSIYYIAHNAALQIDTSNFIPIYYKSKLVSGVETMPFLKVLGFLEKFILDFGGVTGSLAIQKEREVFTNTGLDISIAPVICYESAFGEHVSDYIKKGANFIFIITNDGWWGNTSGYKHHLNYACLRAIETRRSIARSANTGISAFINQRGEILNETSWWTKVAIKNKLKANKKITFYVKYGDYIGRLAVFLAIFIFLYIIQHQLNKSILNKKS